MRVEFLERMIEGPDAAERTDGATVGEAVFSEIRNDILLGALHPGMKLKLASLKRDYDVSINTLRETRCGWPPGLVCRGQKGFGVCRPRSRLREVTELRQLNRGHGLRKSMECDLDWRGGWFRQ